MRVKAILPALATATAAAAQPDIDDYVSNSIKYWSDYGDYLAKVLGDAVKVATIGKDSDHTTYHLSCPSKTASRDFNGCIVGDGATVIMSQNVIDFKTKFPGGYVSQHCSYSRPEEPVCTIINSFDGTSSATTMTVASSDLGLVAAPGTTTDTSVATASTKASPTINTASATASASDKGGSSTDQSATESAPEPAAEPTDNAGIPHATRNGWVIGGAAMAMALAALSVI